MKILESAENYLEAIYILSKEQGSVKSIDIVNYLNFSKPSVSVAMKQLENNGYISRDDNGYISLTTTGKEIATSIYERHLILTNMFMSIGVSKETAAIDACKVEHHISQETFDCLKKHFKKEHSE